MKPSSIYRHARLHRRAALIGAVTFASLGSIATVPIVAGHADTLSAPGFTSVQVDPALAGGEPLVTYYSNPTNGPDLVYTSHEGTTHLFRDGIVKPDPSADNICSVPQVPPQSTPEGYACSYDNQVNVWTSTNHGQAGSWVQTTVVHGGLGLGNLGFHQGPTSPFGAGFSDPDWTIDEATSTKAAWLYNTGIDLANDSVFASNDGGRNFLVGNNNCHGGDRPWLAGGVNGEVFLATDTTVDPSTSLSSGHEIFHGVVTGVPGAQTLVCSGVGDTPDPTGTSVGIKDFGAWQTTGSYSASGKLFYDHNTIAGDPYHGAIIDPAFFSDASGSSGVGISVLKNAAAAFAGGTTTFTQQFEVPRENVSVFAHWPSIAIDSNDVVYLVYDTSDGGANALNNAVKLTTIDLKAASPSFTTPITIHPISGVSAFWPWVTVGSPGNVSVVWYQYDKVVNPDQTLDGNVSLYEKSLFGVGSGTVTPFGPLDAVGTPIHFGGTCQSGTTCVATGQDRRLGDFFTNSVDEKGCVMIATGSTTTATGGNPNGAVARPIFLQQTSGTSLTGQPCAALPPVTTPEVPWTPLLILSGGATGAVLLARRRRGLRLPA